jgi:adenine-specific DNA-methyltransferase
MLDAPEKLDLKSLDLSEEKRQELLRLFPEIRTEGGKIDFDRLKLVLGEMVDVGKERYGMHWPGKADCFKTIQAPSMGTLRPCPEESVNWDTTENLIIEGDNLEVLKLLQKSYLGRVKMIYIDPPYNTGNDFIYPDNYSESLQTYLEYTGQVDAQGRKFGTNTDADGRFHSKWMNMMYPRLYLAKNLLSDDGMIFISIDDHEIDNLKKLCSEIFGEANYCAQFVWNPEGNTDNQDKIKVNHEYILTYYKNIENAEKAIGHVIDPNTPEGSNLWKGIADNNINKNNPSNPPSIVELPIGFPCSEETFFYPKKSVDQEFFNKTKNDGYISDTIKSKYGIEALSGLPIKLDDLVVENHKLTKPCRMYGGMANRNKLIEYIANRCNPIADGDTPLSFYVNINAGIRYHRLNDKPRNILSVLRGFGTTEKTKTYLKEYEINYDYPKPVGLIEYLIKIGSENGGIVLDFFAGSGTTAEATIKCNNSDNKKRNYILVQLPENTQKEDYATISQITKARVVKYINSLGGSVQPTEALFPEEDSITKLGFRFFKLDESNFQPWDANVQHNAEAIAQQLELYIDHIKEGRSNQDLLFEILIKRGFPLTTQVETLTLAGQEVFGVAGTMMLVCLERELTLELIRAMADLNPECVVFLDEGFAGNDQLKTNAVQIFKTKGVAKFLTV